MKATIEASKEAEQALAVLEAAGVEAVHRDYEFYDDGSPEHLEAVMYFLKQYIEARERATAEAKEQAELEAEALELFNAFNHDQKLSHISEAGYPERWLAVARKAREMKRN